MCSKLSIRSGKRYPENEVVGVAKWRIIEQSGKGLINEAKLQKTGAIYKKSIATTSGKLDP